MPFQSPVAGASLAASVLPPTVSSRQEVKVIGEGVPMAFSVPSTPIRAFLNFTVTPASMVNVVGSLTVTSPLIRYGAFDAQFFHSPEAARVPPQMLTAETM